MGDMLDITDYFLDVGCFDPTASEGWRGSVPVPVDSTVTKIQGCISDKTDANAGEFSTNQNFTVKIEGPDFNTPETIATGTWADTDDGLDYVFDMDIDKYVWIPAGNIFSITADDEADPSNAFGFWFNFTVTFSRKCR